MREILEENLKKLIITFPTVYKVDSILQNFNLLSNALDKGEQYLMCCPFHDDVDPSFRIMKKLGIWNCFSCGQSGTLLKLVHRLSVTSLSFYDFCDNLIRSDKIMQSTLGFSTIFKSITDIYSEDKFNTCKKFKPDYTVDLPITILSDFLKRKDNSFSSLKASLSMLQQDISVREIKKFYEEFYKYSEGQEPLQEVSLSDLLL